jgi:hypothetical protein
MMSWGGQDGAQDGHLRGAELGVKWLLSCIAPEGSVDIAWQAQERRPLLTQSRHAGASCLNVCIKDLL